MGSGRMIYSYKVKRVSDHRIELTCKPYEARKYKDEYFYDGENGERRCVNEKNIGIYREHWDGLTLLERDDKAAVECVERCFHSEIRNYQKRIDELSGYIFGEIAVVGE